MSMLTDDLLMLFRVLLIAAFGMPVWQWGEPPVQWSYGCFGGGPTWFDIQTNWIRLHAKAIALISVMLLVGEFALREVLSIRYERACKPRSS